MITRSAFHLDCNPVIPECGFECPKCIKEIESIFAGREGRVFLNPQRGIAF